MLTSVLRSESVGESGVGRKGDPLTEEGVSQSEREAWRLRDLTRYFTALTARPSVARVIDEAREYRDLFPLPWPDYVD
jgi:hypothetical protein